MLPLMSRFTSLGGTYTVTALERHLRPGHAGGHPDRRAELRRVLPPPQHPGDVVPKNVPLHTFNLAGYRSAHTAGTANRYW